MINKATTSKELGYNHTTNSHTYYFYPNQPGVCPGCGRCRQCGQPAPQYPVQPFQPYWQLPLPWMTQDTNLPSDIPTCGGTHGQEA